MRRLLSASCARPAPRRALLASARSVRRPRRRRLLLPRNRRIVRGSLFLVQRVAHMEVRVDSVRAPVTVMGHGTKISARVRNELQDHHLPPPGLGLLNALLTPVSCSRYLPLSCWSMYRAESCELASTYHYIVCHIYMVPVPPSPLFSVLKLRRWWKPDDFKTLDL